MRNWLLFPAFIVACSDSAGSGPSTGGTTTLLPDGGIASTSPDAGAAALATGTELRVPVADGKAYVKLANASLSTDEDWDLAFDGLDVTTNSGLSAHGAGGAGGAFGPLDAINFLGDTAPEVPFMTTDTTGGAFLDWYAYDGDTHALWSRFHHFGVKDGDRLWKVQIESYYGQRDGAAVTALYNLRYAEITGGTLGPTVEVANLDGTAGGLAAPATATSECIDLGTNTRVALTPADARASSAWHICVRRSYISVNGEVGGPRGIAAVDLDAAKSATESLATVKTFTAESQKAAFDAITASSFDGKTFRGDRVVSAFGDYWLDTSSAVPAPTGDAWLVLDAAGKQKFLVGFTSFEGATATNAGTIVMRIKSVKD